MNLGIDELLAYTDDEREKWHQWFAKNGNEPLKIALAAEAHPTVGALILHCFWAEAWYVSLLRGEMLTEDSEYVKQNKDLPSDQAEAIFNFGRSGRSALWTFINSAKQDDWERIYEAEAGKFQLRGSARKLVSHLLVHEIRHWAQIAIVVRQQGLEPPGDHDLIFSQSFGQIGKRLA